jgi:uncharacterized peroxidase-related enzyme
MTFIRTIPPADAAGAVRDMYQELQAKHGFVPNWAQAFSLRPGVRAGWSALVGSIQANLPPRTYELATLAAARALGSSYCSLAHGRVLATTLFDAPAVRAIVDDTPDSPLEPGERAMMAFATQVARDASQVSAADVDGLRAHGFADEQIFDIAAAAAARCFFAKLLDALGTQADSAYEALDPALRRSLTVGRPIDDAPAQRVPAEPAVPA